MSDAKTTTLNLDVVDSPRAKLIPLFLSTLGSASPRAISRKLDMPMLTVYPILSMLRKRELIKMRDGRCVLV